MPDPSISFSDAFCVGLTVTDEAITLLLMTEGRNCYCYSYKSRKVCNYF